MNRNKKLRLAKEKLQSGLDALNAARYQQAVDDSLEAAKLWEELKRNERNYAGCLVNAAIASSKLGYHTEAQKLLEKSIPIQKKILGSKHPYIAESLNNLAIVYEAKGETAKAQNCFEHAQTIINQVLDKSHPTARIISQNYLQLQQTIAELERRNIEQRIALEEANKLNYLGLMATGIAHNINNPVGIIRLAAQRGLRKLETGICVVEGQEIFQRILRQADRLHDIIQGFRKFAHGDRQRRETVELNALVIEIQEYFSSQLEAHHITLKLELSDENPCSHANRFVLQEVLMDLIKNAREALEHTPDAFVIIKTWQQAEKVGLYIEDNGAGIPSAQQKNLFTPFHSTKTDGTGLGLYFANKALADLHGTIIYQERQPNGACFKIELPPVQENENENNSLSNFSG
jgi:C4-dicarboxylate-specific signal transduction histidine kinase